MQARTLQFGRSWSVANLPGSQGDFTMVCDRAIPERAVWCDPVVLWIDSPLYSLFRKVGMMLHTARWLSGHRFLKRQLARQALTDIEATEA